MTIFSAKRGRIVGRRRVPNRKRFEAKLQKIESGCWIWTGWKDKDGYGMFNFRQPDDTLRDIRATHAAYMMFVCSECPPGQANHHCDTPACVNPEHIFFGTQQDNMDDMSAKGRSHRGDIHYKAVLSEDLVRRIRIDAASGLSIASIAKTIGFKESTVRAAALGQNWEHVK